MVWTSFASRGRFQGVELGTSDSFFVRLSSRLSARLIDRCQITSVLHRIGGLVESTRFDDAVIDPQLVYWNSHADEVRTTPPGSFLIDASERTC